jgi:hypothetical protein
MRKAFCIEMITNYNIYVLMSSGIRYIYSFIAIWKEEAIKRQTLYTQPENNKNNNYSL